MRKYDFINVFGVIIGDNFDNSIRTLSERGIDLKEVSNANKRIRQLYIGGKRVSFNNAKYDSIQLGFMDNILYEIVLSEVIDLEKGRLKYAEESKKLSSVFGGYMLEKDTEVLKEYFYTDVFISCIARYSNIIDLDKNTKGYLNIRYFDNISELSKDRTLSNPSIVSIIRDNLSIYKNTCLSNKDIQISSKQKINHIFDIKIIVIFLIGVLFLFLFALNGRYEKIGDHAIFDKWKKQVNIIGSEEVPVKKDGEIIK